MRFFIAAGIAVIAVVFLVYSAVSETKNKVVTVETLLSENLEQDGLRLGARVSADPIEYQTEPRMLLKFRVHDIALDPSTAPPTIAIEYHGIMPDTLQAGRDVILEGQYQDGVFWAKSLMTQCPSKYEPPLPE